MTAHEPVTPVSIFDRARSGDQQAWTQLHDIYRDLVYLRCVKHRLQPADADIITNDVFIAIYRSLSGFSRDKKAFRFLFYIRRITTYKIIDFKRKQSRILDVGRGGESQFLDLVDVNSEDELSEEQVNAAWSEKEFHESLRAKYLPEAEMKFDRTVYCSYHFVEIENRSVESVAAELNLTLTKVEENVAEVVRWILVRMYEFADEADTGEEPKTTSEELTILRLLRDQFEPATIEMYRLKEVLGMPVAIIAMELKKSPGAVRTGAHRVRNWIAEHAPHLLANDGESDAEAAGP